ncbi:MAG: phage holin family protein [Chloroflexota bacterium]|jgi:putative membrane protein
MMKLIIRLLINAVALWVAAQIVSGITLSDSLAQVLIVALVFGIINALIKPIVKVLSFPLIIVTLGLFTLVINAFLLLLTDWLSIGLQIDGFWPAVLGAIIVSVVSWFLSQFLNDD